MKVLGLIIAFGMAGLALAETTPGEKIEKGVKSVKEGAQDAAKEVGAAAEKAGENVGAVGKKVGTAFKSATCPIVGDRKTKVYYAQDNKDYEVVLSGQKYFEDDDRECFLTETKARELGYSRAAR